MHGLILDLGVAVFMAAVVTLLIRKLRQPTILAYLIVGVIIGPEIGPSLINEIHNIEAISEIGIILLLFIIGLEMHPAHLASIFKKVYLPGIGQFMLTFSVGLVVFTLAGFSLAPGNLEVVYLALACSLSSTAIVIKLLYDKAEIDTLAGKLTVGILLMQDVWAIMALAILPHLGDANLTPTLLAVVKSMSLVVVAFILSKYVLGRVFESAADSPETIVILSIGWCAFMVGAGHYLEVSMEMGALIAGISISTFPWSFHVTGQISPLRDFFLTLFFISLGMKIPVPDPSMAVVVVVVLYTMLSRFLTIIPLGLLSGTSLRNSFIAALNLSQISEFSLVIATIGVSLGVIGKNTMALILFAMSITSIISPYLIKYNFTIYRGLERLLHRFNINIETLPGDEGAVAGQACPIILLGYHRGTRALIEIMSLKDVNLLKKMRVVDFNMEMIRELKTQGIAHFYGDLSNFDALRHSGLDKAQIIVSTIPDILLKNTSNLKLVQMCRRLNSQAFIIASADMSHQIEGLKKAGANEVMLPYFEMANHLSELLLNLDHKT